jgi:hypothetical protein
LKRNQTRNETERGRSPLVADIKKKKKNFNVCMKRGWATAENSTSKGEYR